MKFRNVSASFCEKWDQCPLQWKAIYVDRIPSVPGKPAQLGTAVHETLETVVNASKDAFFPLTYETVLPRMLKKHDVPEFAEQAEAMVQQAIRWGYTDGLNNLVGVEEEFMLPLEDGTNVHGFIDRLDWEPVTQTLTVYDLKTGRPKTRKQQAKAWQTRIYNWAARKLYPMAATCQVTFLYLKKSPVTVVQTAEDAAQCEADMNALVKTIHETEEPQPITGPLCDWCPLFQAKQCPAFVTPDLERYRSAFPIGKNG